MTTEAKDADLNGDLSRPEAVAAPEPDVKSAPSVTVELVVDEYGARVGNLTAVGLGVDQYQFWLEKGVQHLRRSQGFS